MGCWQWDVIVASPPVMPYYSMGWLVLVTVCVQDQDTARDEEAAAAEAGIDPNDPFAAKDMAEHDKMVALAKSFEAKYVTTFHSHLDIRWSSFVTTCFY